MPADRLRLDNALTSRGITTSRSQSESWIKLGKVTVDGQVVTKPGHFVRPDSDIKLNTSEQYVSRAGLKLASVAKLLNLDFDDKVVLDVGSSTGGFTDYALQHGARKIYAVDVGTDQLHPSLRGDKRILLHEKTDIRDVVTLLPLPSSKIPSESLRRSLDSGPATRATPPSLTSFGSGGVAPSRVTRASVLLDETPGIIVVDVSFISLREILPHLYNFLSDTDTKIVAMVKPQFEAGKNQTNKGIIKNDAVRRQILRDFEEWSRQYFVIVDKRDSDVAGAKGNQERFYLLKPLSKAH